MGVVVFAFVVKQIDATEERRTVKRQIVEGKRGPQLSRTALRAGGVCGREEMIEKDTCPDQGKRKEGGVG